MVEQLQISNFKSIRDQTVELRRINLLIGQNGAGKSNFIGVIAFLEHLVARELADYIVRKGGFGEFVHGGLEANNSFGISIRLSDEGKQMPAVKYFFHLRQNGAMYGFSREGFDSDDGEELMIHGGIGGGSQETSLQYLAGGADPFESAQYLITYLRTLRVYHFHDTSDNARVKLPQDVFNAHFLQSEAENLAPFLLNLQQNHPLAYADIVAAVKLVYPPFADFFLRESPFAKGKMELLWRERGNEAVLHARQLSDGTLRFICLATLLLQPPELPDAPRTLVLDEPELGLHPFALHVLAELLHKAAVHRQVIVATQSVGLLNYFEPEDLLIVERTPQGETTFARKTSDELRDWLQDYSLGQLWESNLLGGRP